MCREELLEAFGDGHRALSGRPVVGRQLECPAQLRQRHRILAPEAPAIRTRSSSDATCTDTPGASCSSVAWRRRSSKPRCPGWRVDRGQRRVCRAGPTSGERRAARAARGRNSSGCPRSRPRAALAGPSARPPTPVHPPSPAPGRSRPRGPAPRSASRAGPRRAGPPARSAGPRPRARQDAGRVEGLRPSCGRLGAQAASVSSRIPRVA